MLNTIYSKNATEYEMSGVNCTMSDVPVEVYVHEKISAWELVAQALETKVISETDDVKAISILRNP